MTGELASTDGPLHEAYDAILLDLDGVVYLGPHAVPGAADALRAAVAAGSRPAYLTNNAARTAVTVAQHLRDLGMPVDDDDAVVTSAQAIARVMADDLAAGARVLVVGAEGLSEPLRDAGLVPVRSLDDAPVAVVQGFDPDTSWHQLAEAAYAVQAGLPWYASNSDRTVPTPRGIAPGNGALVETVRIATGAEPVIAGKPERPLFDETLRRIAAERPLMVGDRLDTDIDGAIGAGIPSLVVLTGVSTLAEMFSLAPPRRPDFIAYDLGGLGQVHEPVDIDGDTARCAGMVATLDDGRIEVDADPRAVGALRAALQLAWSIRDASGADVIPGGTLDL